MSKFDKSSVPQEAFAEWQACDERPLSEHFLKGWLIATEAVLKAAGMTLEQMTGRKDQKMVFGIIKEAARPRVKMSVNTFERYAKIARYCVIYACPWEVAQDATRELLRECKKRVANFKVGTLDEKWERALKDELEYQKVQDEKAAAERKQWNAENSSKDEDAVNDTKEFFSIPLPKPGQDEDAYWMKYLMLQVAHIKKHLDKLEGGSSVKSVVTNFFASALPLVAKVKVQAKNADMEEAA